MAGLCALACINILLPSLIDDDKSNLWVIAQDFDRLVGTSVVISNNRISEAGEIIQRVWQYRRFIAHPRHGDEQMLLAEKSFVASYDLLVLAELPATVLHLSHQMFAKIIAAVHSSVLSRNYDDARKRVTGLPSTG